MKKLLLSVAALGCFASAQAQWTTSGTNVHTTNSGSFVGIGTTTPNSKLDLGGNFGNPGTAPNKISLYWQSNNNYYGFGISEGTLDYFTAGNHRFHVFDAGGVRREVFFINQSGSVGIGTATPNSYKLAVEGKVGAREVVVTTAPWADYVFAGDYKLRSLSEVAQFIRENKHLPEVPTAAEVAKNGNSLAETDALLLRKIEELTLYVIELKQENELQAAKIKALETQPAPAKK